jgi:hypothetical protein
MQVDDIQKISDGEWRETANKKGVRVSMLQQKDSKVACPNERTLLSNLVAVVFSHSRHLFFSFCPRSDDYIQSSTSTAAPTHRDCTAPFSCFAYYPDHHSYTACTLNLSPTIWRLRTQPTHRRPVSCTNPIFTAALCVLHLSPRPLTRQRCISKSFATSFTYNWNCHSCTVCIIHLSRAL